MRIKYAATYNERAAFGCLVLFFAEDHVTPPKQIPPALKVEIGRLAVLKDFTGKSGQTSLLPTPSGNVARLLCVGMGKGEKLDAEALRRAGGTAAKELSGMNLETAAVLLPEPDLDSLKEALGERPGEVLGEALCEGMVLGGYKFEEFKKEEDEGKPPKKNLKEITLFDSGGVTSRAAVKRAVTRGDAVCLARTLGNRPANILTPTRLAAEAAVIAKKHGLKLRVVERKELERLGMGLFLGVAKGSSEPPKLIVMEYSPRGAKGRLALVGKGITFDSGGISLKPGLAMDEMKFDMCGAAAVLGAMEGIAVLKPRVNVVAVIPACENLPSGDSVKPGDILTSYSGKTVEILNTDAEGRLILADALAYAIKKFKPDAVVDLATLTGACVIALGHYATGALTNDEELLAKVTGAGKAAGELIWPLPNFVEYEEQLKGKYAELQNVGTRDGGAITAGLFLKQFVGEVPWVHLDIAGTAWGVKNIGYIPNQGATGVGVRLLIQLACNWNQQN